MHQTFSGKAKTFTLIVLFVFLFLYLSCSRSQRVTIRLAGDEWFLDSLTTTGMIGVFEQQSGIHVKVLHKNDRAISAFLASVPVAREKSTIPESGQMTGAAERRIFEIVSHRNTPRAGLDSLALDLQRILGNKARLFYPVKPTQYVFIARGREAAVPGNCGALETFWLSRSG
jgi:hypothetical protein